MADLKTLITREMKAFFGADQKRIDHALKVAGYAEEILAAEGGDREVVLAAALLHDIGIQAAEQKYGSSAGKYQEIEGPPIAKGILEKVGFPAGNIAEVLEIIAHHHSGGIETKNFKTIWDADWLVNIPDEVGLQDRSKVEKIIAKVVATVTGKQIAAKLFLTLFFVLLFAGTVLADTEFWSLNIFQLPSSTKTKLNIIPEVRFRSGGREFYYLQTYIGPAFPINKNFELDLYYAFNYTKNGGSWAGKSLGYLDGVYQTDFPWLTFTDRGRFELDLAASVLTFRNLFKFSKMGWSAADELFYNVNRGFFNEGRSSISYSAKLKDNLSLNAGYLLRRQRQNPSDDWTRTSVITAGVIVNVD